MTNAEDKTEINGLMSSRGIKKKDSRLVLHCHHSLINIH